MFLALLLAAALSNPAACENLKSLSLPNTTITSAQPAAAGPFIPPAAPGAGGPPPGPVQLPPHCRVSAVAKPSPDSNIEFEVWLPENWNGKFEAVGGGGWAGVISYPAMSIALQEGYATASTDTGHKGGNALFAIDHPEKLTDFAYRAIHEMTVQAKAIISAYYSRAPRLSYFNGCSTGGRQGLMEAQKFPEDFDAIVAGAPANYQTHLHVWDLSVSVPVLKNPAAAVSAETLALVNKAVVQACDARDGITDGILNDPRACKFDVSTLQCKQGDAQTCLTAAQVEAVQRVYEPAKTASGEVVFPGKEFGSETGWIGVLGGQQAPGVSVGSFLVAYNDAKWDAKTFDLNRDLKIVDEKVGVPVNAINPDLRAFKARGGKLILYHGWNDTAISPGNTINYYESVLSKMGTKRAKVGPVTAAFRSDQDDWIRLFMAPGMQHCGGGPGPNQINWMAALERWRESGIAPNQVEAVHIANNRVDMTRPLCAYPQQAVYKGTGSTNDAQNFVCK